MAGLGFARSQLEKQGWSEGKGLGKEEDGITKAIKVGIKNDTQGVGYKISDQFTFHWWDHVFNKTAKSIQVKENEDGVDVTKDGESSQMISSKRPNKHSKKPLLYGRFVKASSTTPTTTSEDLERKSESSDDETEKDFSSRHPEDIVFKACGGRTAHKGARHGLKLNGKLKRIEEQERIAMSAPCSRSASPDVTKEHDIEQKTAELLDQLKSKKKKRKSKEDELKSYSDSEGCVVKKKKKKRKRNREEEGQPENEVFEEERPKTEDSGNMGGEDMTTEREEPGTASDLRKTKKKKNGKTKDENFEKKKKKKKSSNLSDDEECLVTGLGTSKETKTTRNEKDKVKATCNSNEEQSDLTGTKDKDKRKTKKRNGKNVENETEKDEKEPLSEKEDPPTKKKKKKRKTPK